MAENKDNKKRLKDWLDTIQQDSWQLELVISGILIFLLLGAYEPLQSLNTKFAVDILTGSVVLTIVASAFFILKIAYFSLLITFFLHLTLRGLWIGAVGLRSVSGDFDYEVLGYQPKYTDWLRKRLGSFDDYIERLELQCSLAFSFAFLIFFCVISIGAYILVLAGVTIFFAWLVGLESSADPAGWQVMIPAIANIVLVLLGVVYLIDFSSLGWLKKKRWLRRAYFPFYRVMGVITLARAYRPFYYNLIDHPFGRRLVKWLWVIIFGSLIMVSISITRYTYYPTTEVAGSVINPDYYLDEGEGRNFSVARPSIASRYAERDYLAVFIPYQPVAHDRFIEYLYPGLAAARSSDFAIDGPVHLWNSQNAEVNNDSLLIAHRSLHRLYLNDSLLTNVPWRFYQHPARKQPGLRYDLPVYDLPRGEHELRFEGCVLTMTDSLYWREEALISIVR